MTTFRFVSSPAPAAQAAYDQCVAAYGQAAPGTEDVLVAIGGDGFMLHVLADQRMRHATGAPVVPVYGINYGTLGFLMNRDLTSDPQGRDLPARVAAAAPQELVPLRVEAFCEDGTVWTRWGFNEIAVRRAGPQSATLKVLVNGHPRIDRLSGDGLLVATPAGSGAYNYSAGGPVLPLSAAALALTPICPIVPRRWPGAVLPASAGVHIEVLDRGKRPVVLSADTHETGGVVRVAIRQDRSAALVALFDTGHDLEQRLLEVQFAH